MSEDPHPEHLAVNPQTVKRPAIPEFKPDEEGVYRFKCWLPHDTMGFLHPKGRTKGWTTHSWDTMTCSMPFAVRWAMLTSLRRSV